MQMGPLWGGRRLRWPERRERELESRSKPSLTGLLPAERASEASGREVKLAEG